MPRLTKLSSSLYLITGALLSAGGLVRAQETQELQRVTVTGSNIKRTDTETASPVQVITRDDIQKSGKTTVADVVLGLNASNNGSVPLSFGIGFAAGGSGVSLRGLGANSTLILLNGRRMAPFGLADDGQRSFVDLSTIPLDAVERIDVVKDGASAIYGSDAIAGVINIITRQDFKGLILNASYGQTRYGDGRNPKASITGGFGELAKDKYNVFFTLEASKTGEVRQSDRANRGDIGNPDVTGRGYDFEGGLVLGFGRPSALPGPTSVSSSPYGWARAVTGPNSATTVPGSYYKQIAAPAGGCSSSLVSTLPAGYSGCPWNAVDYLQLQSPEDKLNFLTRGTLEISPDLTAFAEVGLFSSKVKTSFTPSSVSGTWPDVFSTVAPTKTNTNITMGPNHPDNPNPGSYSRLRYATADLGGRRLALDTVVTRAITGLRGAAAGWEWESALLYTESKTDVQYMGYIRNSVLRDYLNGTNVTGLNPTSTYYRLGANAGLNSAAVNNAISPTLDFSNKTSVASLDVKANRELAQLAGGPLQLAVGAEFRQEKTNSPAVPYTDVADIVGLGYASFSSSRNVTAAFGELSAPVLKNLELSAALRVDRYSDYGTSTTPKVGFKYVPIPQLVLRGTYAEGFRAPGPAENGKSAAAGFTSYVDPIRCPITGSAADCGPGNATLGITSGNPSIEPEKSKSFTVGLVFEPTKETSLSVDFWEIRRKNEILQADVSSVLANPTGVPGAAVIRQANDDPIDKNTGLPVVGAGGTVLAVTAPYANGPSTKTNGVDFDVRQRFNMGDAGKLTGVLTFSHTFSFKRTLTDGSVREYAGTYGPTSLSSTAGAPKDKATFGLTWDRGPVSMTGTVNYVSGIKNVEFKDDPAGCLILFADGSDAPSGCKTPSFTTFDLSAKYQITKSLQIYGSVLNLFDRVAPYDLEYLAALPHYNQNYNQIGGLGRTYNIGLKYQFD